MEIPSAVELPEAAVMAEGMGREQREVVVAAEASLSATPEDGLAVAVMADATAPVAPQAAVVLGAATMAEEMEKEPEEGAVAAEARPTAAPGDGQAVVVMADATAPVALMVARAVPETVLTVEVVEAAAYR